MKGKNIVAAALLVLSLAANATGQDDLTFDYPTSTRQIAGCGYSVKTCANKTRHHTAIDYQYSGTDPNVYASNRGKVVRLQVLGLDDHGMGTNIILEHELASGGTLYTTYSHLAFYEPGLTVGSLVEKGQRLGLMGGSGHGQAGYWPFHLHFEVKDAPVTHNPSGPGIHYGYTPSHPDGFGYHNPNSVIGVVEVKPLDVEISLTSPDGGRLKRGFNVSVEWITAGASGDDEVTIYLKRDRFSRLQHPDGRNYAILATAERNDGSFVTNVPIGLAPARDWRVYVELNGRDRRDASDRRIRIR